MNNNTHPCANKCSEFKDGEQCHHCLIPGNSEISNSSDFIMGDDAHIENHISPLCKTESQPVLIVERGNQIIERLKVENVVLQAKVDELQAENKILNQAASTHLKNQMHFKKLYDALVEQLYPYAIDLEEPVDGDVNITPQEFINGYNRAHECVHYNLLEMMESDVEYIKAQCGMFGGEA